MARVDRGREVASSAAAAAAAGLAHYLGWPAAVRLLLAGVALACLARLLSDLGEGASGPLGQRWTAFLQGLLGNLPELLVIAFSLGEGKPLLAKYAVAGSLAANALLVVGLSAVAARPRRPVPLAALKGYGGAVLAAACLAVLLLYPPLLGLPAGAQETLSLAAAAALLVAFLSWQLRSLAGEPFQLKGNLLVLGGLGAVGTATAFVSEWFVGAVYPAAAELGTSRPFMGLVVVGIAANGVEHGSAVLLAARGSTSLAGEIVSASLLQVGGFLLPWAVLLAAPLGGRPTLAVDGAALICLLVSGVDLAFVKQGVGVRAGAALLLLYLAVATVVEVAFR